jgi:hypothetical protein
MREAHELIAHLPQRFAADAGIGRQLKFESARLTEAGGFDTTFDGDGRRVRHLLGAIVVKAEAVGVDDAKENQRQDLAFLLSLVVDPRAMAERLDMEYGGRKAQASELKQLPSEYLKSGRIFIHCELEEQGLTPGRLLKVREVRALDEVVTVEDEDGATRTIGGPLAGSGFVRSASED